MTINSTDDDKRTAQLPIHLAQPIKDLRLGIENRGEHTVAGELVALIDAVFSHLSRLWVAEYLHAGAPDPRLNRDLFDWLGRHLRLGDWVYIGSKAREACLSESLDLVVNGLAAQDFGDPDDPDHPVVQLLQYRNSYSHGSLAAVAEDIRMHRRMLDDILARLPALADQPIRFRSEDGGLYTATVDWAPVPDGAGDGEPSLQPFIVGKDGRTLLRLYPLLYVAHDENGFALRYGKQETNPSLISLFERDTLRIHYERYLHERRGHLNFEAEVARRATVPVPESALNEVVAALNDDAATLTLIEAHPGCGKATVLNELARLAPPERYAVVALFVVSPGDLGQSGATFSGFLLRQIERALGLKDGHYGDDHARLLATVKEASDALRKAGRRLLVGLEDLHHGFMPYRREPVTVAQVYTSLTGSAIDIVATVHPHRIEGHLLFDRKVILPIPEADRIDKNALARAVHELCPPDAALRRRVLRLLLEAEKPASLFGLCDALDVQDEQETQNGTIFEPKVERALWDLAPLLRIDRDGLEKSWALFSPVLRTIDLSSG